MKNRDKTKEQLVNELVELRQRVADLEAVDTERQRAEEALRESEGRFRESIENANDIIYTHDLKGNFTSANPAATRIYGYTNEEILQLNIAQIVDSEYLPLARQKIREKLEGALRTGPYELLTYGKENRPIWVEVSTHLLEGEGQPVGVLGIARNITDRKRVEEALKESESKLSGILSSMVDLVFAFDSEGRFIFHHAPHTDDLYLPPDAFMGKMHSDVMPPHLNEPFVEAFEENKRGKVVEFEYWLEIGGRVRWYSAKSSPVFIESGFTGSVAVVREITERRWVEETLQKKTRQQEKLLETAHYLTASLDFREVLTRIAMGAKEILEARGCTIYLLEPDSKTLTPVVAIEPPYEEKILSTPLDVEASFTGQAIKARHALVFNDAAVSILGQQIPGTPFEEEERVIVAPLIVDGKVLGAMCLSRTGTSFSHEDLALAETFATYAVTALKNAQTHDELQREVEERKRVEEEIRQRTAHLQALQQMGLELTAELELDALLHSIASWAVELLGGTGGGISLYRPELDVIEWAVNVGETQVPVGSILHRGEGLAGQVWETGQPLIVDDYQHWEGRTAIYDELTNVAVVSAPVHWGDQFLGVLNVLAEPLYTFSLADAELLGLFAQQAAIAIRNARLYEAERRYSAELDALRQASLHLTSTLELQTVLEAILDHTIRLVAADDAHVFLYDGERLSFGAALWADAPQQEPYAEPRPQGLTYTVALTGERVFVPDVDKHPLFQDWPWGGAIVGLPLRIGQRVGGVMTVAFNRPHVFDESERRVLGLLADQAAIAIENARLYGEAKKQADELTALYETGKDIISILELDALLQLIVERSASLTEADKSLILLLDPEAEKLTKVVGFGFAPGQVEGFTYQEVQDGISGWVLRERIPTMSEDILTDPRNTGLALDKAKREPEKAKSIAVAPLLIKGEVIGTLTVINNVGKPIFSQDDLDSVVMLGSQAAIAIENARLYEETRQRALEQETLREAALALTTALDRNEVIDRILAQLQQVVPYDSASVQFLREDQMELVGGRGFSNLPDLLGISFPADGDNPNSEVIRTRAPFIVEDAPTVYEGFRKGPHVQTVVRSWLGVPMLIGEQLVGMIALDKREPGFYTQEHARLAEAFAAQAAVAIENARLFEETQQRVAELDTLRRTSLQLTSSLDLHAVLDSIAKNALSLVGATNCHLYLYDETSDTFTFGAALWEDGRHDAAVKTPRRDGLAALVAQEGQAVVINDATQHPFYTTPETRKWGLHAIASFPLKRAGQVLGVFSIAFLTPHTFSREELRVLGLLTDQAAVAIENARLFSEAEQRATELSTMLEVARAVSSTLDLEQVPALVAEEMVKATGVAGCTLSRWDREADAMVTFTEWRQRRLEDTDVPGTSYALDDFPATRAVLEKRQPISILATDPDADPSEIALLQKNGSLSLLILPLIVGERVIGLVELDETEHEREFTDAEIHLCQALADQVAVALENARLFEEEKRRSTQLALINEVGEKAASILEPDRLMQEVIRSIQESFNYYNAALLLLDNERRELVMQAIAGGFEHGVADAYRQSVDEGIIGFVARTGKSWLARDVSKDPYYIKGFAEEEILTGSELCVPVKLGDKVIGALDVHSIHLNDFDQADVVVMEAMADRLAMGIQNARLYEEMAGLYDVGLAVTSALELDKTLRVIYEQVNRLMSPE